MKRCTQCGAVKTLGEFYTRNDEGSPSLRSACKYCTLKKQREWKDRNPEKVRAQSRAVDRARMALHQRNSHMRHKDRYSERLRRWRQNNPGSMRAHAALAYAIKIGKIVRPTKCEECGMESRIHAHHHDYSKPLDVKWLCVRCHAATMKRPPLKQAKVGT